MDNAFEGLENPNFLDANAQCVCGHGGVVVLFKQNIILFMFTILLSIWPYITKNIQACLFSRKVVIALFKP
jgi:hypothetical protein